MNDLVLKGGRVVDPSQGLDKVTDIAFSDGKVAAIGDNRNGDCRKREYRHGPWCLVLCQRRL